MIAAVTTAASRKKHIKKYISACDYILMRLWRVSERAGVVCGNILQKGVPRVAFFAIDDRYYYYFLALIFFVFDNGIQGCFNTKKN